MIVSIINNKGGTGKTTTSLNFCAALGAKGNRVLLIDMDAQANASLALGLTYGELAPSIFNVLFDDMSIREAVRSTGINNLDLIAGSVDLVNGDLYLDESVDREQTLKFLLSPMKEEYDCIVLDCSPSLSLLNINALIASDKYIIPLNPEYLSLEGLITTVKTIKKIDSRFEPKSLGILFTMVLLNQQSVLSSEYKFQLKIIKLVKNHYPKSLFNTFIPRDFRFSESISYGQSIFEFAPKSKAAFSYAKLAEEFLYR